MKPFEFSPQAQNDLRNIENFLLENWSIEVLFDFADKLENAIQTILNDQVVFQKYEDTSYHKYLITKHNTLIYSKDLHVLRIHRILQNFQNPEENYKTLT